MREFLRASDDRALSSRNREGSARNTTQGPITDATAEVFCWAKHDTGELTEQGRILLVHARCRKTFEKANAHLHWSHLPLECLPIAFGDRLNLNWVDARARTERLTGA